MDDFTKEELEEIKRCLKYMINGGIAPYSLLTMNTKKKVQNLIDTYCDHEIGNYFVNHGSIMFSNRKCNKCGKII